MVCRPHISVCGLCGLEKLRECGIRKQQLSKYMYKSGLKVNIAEIHVGLKIIGYRVSTIG